MCRSAQVVASPLRFEENHGASAHKDAKYIASGTNFVLSLAPGQSWLEWKDADHKRTAKVQTRLAGGNPQALMEPDGRLPGSANYFVDVIFAP